MIAISRIWSGVTDGRISDDLDDSFWVVDVEGNGARPPEIIELAMIRVEGGVLSPRTQHWLIRPVQRIAPAVSRIHGISDGGTWRMRPPWRTWADDIRERLDELAIVGHNVRVEFDILTRTLEDWRPTAAVDTLRLARAILPDLPSHKLRGVGEALGLTEEARKWTGQVAHSALFDATLTALAFVELVRKVPLEDRPELLRCADILSVDQPRLL